MIPDFVQKAQEIATKAHAGQVDKAGVDYIQHPYQVFLNVQKFIEKNQENTDTMNDREHYYLHAIAWLHDVLEDTDITMGNLLEAGIPQEVIDGVIAITKIKGEPNTDYYARVKKNRYARVVKVADVLHNSDPERLSALGPDLRDRLTLKYMKALRELSS